MSWRDYIARKLFESEREPARPKRARSFSAARFLIPKRDPAVGPVQDAIDIAVALMRAHKRTGARYMPIERSCVCLATEVRLLQAKLNLIEGMVDADPDKSALGDRIRSVLVDEPVLM